MDTKAEKSKPANKEEKLIEKIASLYATIGLVVTRFDAYDGVLVMRDATQRATELVAVAKHHKQMMQMLETLVESNDYIALALGHGIMAYAILAHHGRIRADQMMLASFNVAESQVLGGMPSPVPPSSQGVPVEVPDPYAQNGTLKAQQDADTHGFPVTTE